MEELFELENILGKWPAQTLDKDLGQPWDEIHSQMQGAIRSNAKILPNNKTSITKNNFSAVSAQQPPYFSQINRMPIIKQRKTLNLGLVKTTNRQPKLKISENQLESCSTQVSERKGMGYLFKLADPIKIKTLIIAEVKEDNDIQFLKGNTTKQKSKSDHKAIVFQKIMGNLTNLKSTNHISSKEDLLAFSQIVGKNNKFLPSIYNNNAKENQKSDIDEKKQAGLSLFKSLDNLHPKCIQKLHSESTCYQNSQLLSNLRSRQQQLPFCILSTFEKKQKSQEKPENARKACLIQTNILEYFRQKTKSIHSLDSKKRTSRVSSLKLKYKSQQKMKSQLKKKQNLSRFHHKSLKIARDWNCLKQVKYRLILNGLMK